MYKEKRKFHQPFILYSICVFSMAPILQSTKRFRRDARSMEEEEEIWFDGDEEFEETDNILPMTDMLNRPTNKDTVFDQINRFLERKSIGSHCKFTECSKLQFE